MYGVCIRKGRVSTKNDPISKQEHDKGETKEERMKHPSGTKDRHNNNDTSRSQVYRNTGNQEQDHENIIQRERRVLQV